MTTCQATTRFSGSTVGNTIPTEIGWLTQLTDLNLGREELTGTIPSTLASLTQLTRLTLSSNQLTGTIPSTLTSLTQLNWLDLYNNTQLLGTIPSTLCSVSVGIRMFIDCANVACMCCYDGSTVRLSVPDAACPGT